MQDGLHWEYRQGTRDLALYDCHAQLGRVSVVRDAQGHITGGVVLLFDASKTNLIDFFEKTQEIPGVLPEDITGLLDIKDGFFVAEGYIPRVANNVFCVYETDSKKRELYRQKFAMFRKAAGMRGLDLIDQIIDQMRNKD